MDFNFFIQFNNQAIIPKADSYRNYRHFGTCSECRKNGLLLLCESCPCAYHPRCLKPKIEDIPEGAWFCNPCMLSGAYKKIVIHEKDKNESLCNSHILIWLRNTRRWTSTLILQWKSDSCIFLCEYWKYVNSEKVRVMLISSSTF